MVNRLSRRCYMRIKKTYTKATNKRLQNELLEKSSYNELQEGQKILQNHAQQKAFPIIMRVVNDNDCQ